MGETMRARLEKALQDAAMVMSDGTVISEYAAWYLTTAVLAEMREPTKAMLLACCAKAAEEQCRPISVNVTDAAAFWQAMIDEASK